MTRKPRIAFPGAVYHVMNRGVDGRDIFIDDRDRGKRIELLERTVRRYEINLFAYALMDNHDHYFFRTLQPNISAALHYFNSCYCTWFNKRYHRRGVLFQSRFTDHLVEDQGHFLELSRYIHLNPVRAGLVEYPQDYPWSSYAGYFNRNDRVEWIRYEHVLGEFALEEELAAKQYRKFVEMGVEAPPRAPWEEAIGGVIIGSIGYAEQVTRELKAQELPVPVRLKTLERPGLEEIAAKVERVTGKKLSDLRSAYRDPSLVRALNAYVAKRIYGYSNREVAHWLGLKNQASIPGLIKRAKAGIEEIDQLAEVTKNIKTQSILSIISNTD